MLISLLFWKKKKKKDDKEGKQKKPQTIQDSYKATNEWNSSNPWTLPAWIMEKLFWLGIATKKWLERFDALCETHLDMPHFISLKKCGW